MPSFNLYRAVISFEVVIEALAGRVATIDYPDFKGSVADPGRHDAYSGVWRQMRAYQQ